MIHKSCKHFNGETYLNDDGEYVVFCLVRQRCVQVMACHGCADFEIRNV